MSAVLTALNEAIAKYEGIVERLRTDDLYHKDGHLRWVSNDEELYIGTRGCSLCKLFYKETEDYYECTGCPLIGTGKGCLQEASPWSLFFRYPRMRTAEIFANTLKLARDKMTRKNKKGA